MQSGLLKERLEGFKTGVSCIQTGVKLRLVMRVQSGQVHRADCVGERGQLRGVARCQRGNQQRRGKKLFAQILWIWPALRKVDLQSCAAEVLVVHCVQQLDGDRKSTRLNSSHLGISYAV